MSVAEIQAAFSGAHAENTEHFNIRLKAGLGYVAISPAGRPSFLFEISDTELPPGRALGSIRTSFVKDLEFDVDGSSWTHNCAVVECADSNLLRTFCSLGYDLTRELDGEPTSAKAVLEALRNWDDLLRRRDAMSSEQVIGLWGELCLLSRFPNLDEAIVAWRGPDGDTVDFFGNEIGLEVKTTRRPLRHHLSASQQNYGAEESRVYLVSVCIQEDSSKGISLPVALDRLLDRVSDERALIKKVRKVGYRDEHRQEYGTRYIAVDDPKFFPMGSIPAVREWDPGVLNVRYDVDLSQVDPIPQDQTESLLKRIIGTE